jgi:hypothetical protein
MDAEIFSQMSGPVSAAPANRSIPFDLSRGLPILALPVSENEAQATMVVQQLLSLVPDPMKAEKAKEVESDPILAAYAPLRAEVQRMVTGAKAKNAVAYGRYLVEGLKQQRPIITPPITLYHPNKLEPYPLEHGLVALLLPYGDFFVAIDGETQRIAWQLAAQEYQAALLARVKVVIHHGKTLTDARQGFYDLNTREVKPNAAVAIAMDSLDVATRITRAVMQESTVLGRGVGVNLMRRQLRKTDPELMTISGLRTGVVTTILGAPGLQVGSRPIDAAQLPDGTDEEALTEGVVDVWTALLEGLEDELQPERRPSSVVSAPALLAGLGVLAHHAVPKPPRRDGTAGWSVEQVVEHLEGVNWDRTYVVEHRQDEADVLGSRWDGIAGKFTPSGAFSIGGPKEVGYAVADALENPDSEGGRQIRAASS